MEKDLADLIEGERDGKVIFKTGASRSTEINHLRYDLIPPCALRELAEVFCEGAIVHGDNNWKKGMDEGVIINHAMEHLMKYREGDRKEKHLGKVMWAMSAMIYFRETDDGNS